MCFVKGGFGSGGEYPNDQTSQCRPNCGAEVWLKYEVGNPTGSYKDRMAMSVLANAIE